MFSTILLTAGGVVGFLVFTALVRSGHFFRTLIYTVVTGNLALLGTAWLGAFSGVLLAVNLFTVAVASILGVPGVLTMVILKLLFGV
ncbi:MAG: hypothetical protein HFG20_08800 [Anaerotruncus sp.]|nr:hypothetical protein [Anaerotruncus sp.]